MSRQADAPGPIRLVVFDLGRVLVRICDDWDHAAKVAGVDFSIHGLSSTSQQETTRLLHLIEAGDISFDDFVDKMSVLTQLNRESVRKLSECYIFGPFPGAEQLLNDLAGTSMPVACLSNTNEHHWRLLSEADHHAWFPMHRFHHRFASHLIRARKPNAEIYAHLEKVTAAQPDTILFFDDVPENIAAARTRGWNAHPIDTAMNEPIGQIRAVLRKYNVPL